MGESVSERTGHHFAAAEGGLEVCRVVHRATRVDAGRARTTGRGSIAHDVVCERAAIVPALIRDGDTQHRGPMGKDLVGTMETDAGWECSFCPTCLFRKWLLIRLCLVPKSSTLYGRHNVRK